MGWTAWAWLAVGCPKPTPVVEGAAAPVASERATSGWQCTAFVTRATAAEPLTVDGSGPDDRTADEAAWQRACAVLPPSHTAERCELEAPPDGWSWTRTVQSAGTVEAPQSNVTLTFTPDPVPYQGTAGSPASQDDACAEAYARACAAAEAPTGCQTAGGFVDGGVSAVEGER